MNDLADFSLTWADLVEAFHDSTLKRGHEYARRRRVLQKHLSYNDSKGVALLEGTVRGTSSNLYQVHIELVPTRTRQIQINADCTCPVGYNCKHAAATLITHYALEPHAKTNNPVNVASQTKLAHAAAPHPTAPHPTAPRHAAPHHAAPFAHQSWLDALGALGQQPAPNTPQHKLVAQIHVNPRNKAVVQLLYGRLNKEGGLTGLTKANSSWTALIASPPRYMAPTDVPRVLRLERATDRISLERTLEHDIDGLREWVDAGQAVVQQAQRHYTALTWGATRHAQSHWLLDEQGRQRFSFSIEPTAHLFIADGLFYLDTAAAQMGPVEADITFPLARVLLQAPPIEINDVPTVTQQLQAMLHTLPPDVPRPPLPQPIAIRTLKAKPVVHLRLGEDMRCLTVHAQVRYGELGVHLNDKGAPRLLNGALVQPTLNAAVHRKVAKALRGVDLVPIRDQGNESRYVGYDDDIPMQLMHEHLPRWQEQGWEVSFDPTFRWHLVSAQNLSLDTAFESGNDWFSVDLGVEIDGQRRSLLPILTQLLHDRAFLDAVQDDDADARSIQTLNLRIDDHRLVSMPFERLRTILRTLVELHQAEPNKPLRLARTDALRLQDLADQGLKWNGPAPLLQLAQRLKNFTQIAPVPAPKGLLAELRSYQHAGLAWMQFLREYELAGILADDMGLGKTVQTIAHILTEKNAGRLDSPALVVAPTSVVHNWEQELARFAPQLKVLTLHGAERSNRFDDIAHSDVVISSYPLLPRDIETLEKQTFHLAVFDEAQYIKNARTRASEAAARLRVTHRLALSGTPVENHLGELWSLFHVLLPGFLGDSRRFAQLYRSPIEKQGNLQRQAHLARRVKPFILRRTKDMVAQELPPKTEIEHSVDMEGAQRDLYETVRATMEKRVRDALAAKGLAQSHIVVLDALLKLRQVCCDPRLVRSTTAKKVKASAKLERLMELLPELIAEGRRILLFSQFTSMLDLIEPQLQEAGIEFVRLTGDTKDRKTPVARFQKGEVPLFLISLKAGGTGLNLTAADTVIHYDPWWNPAVENQATDRAHRIGQDKPVFVHRLITQGTVEERIRAMQARKADLARGILDEDAALTKALTAQDFEALFEPLGA